MNRAASLSLHTHRSKELSAFWFRAPHCWVPHILWKVCPLFCHEQDCWSLVAPPLTGAHQWYICVISCSMVPFEGNVSSKVFSSHTSNKTFPFLIYLITDSVTIANILITTPTFWAHSWDVRHCTVQHDARQQRLSAWTSRSWNLRFRAHWWCELEQVTKHRKSLVPRQQCLSYRGIRTIKWNNACATPRLCMTRACTPFFGT